MNVELGSSAEAHVIASASLAQSFMKKKKAMHYFLKTIIGSIFLKKMMDQTLNMIHGSQYDQLLETNVRTWRASQKEYERNYSDSKTSEEDALSRPTRLAGRK